uniref:Uncharacterized protein n=1 Tax=Romanomermis culicivorax TaxID=13658 RepID=A0A915IM48_ROMCU
MLFNDPICLLDLEEFSLTRIQAKGCAAPFSTVSDIGWEAMHIAECQTILCWDAKSSRKKQIEDINNLK